MVAIGTHLEGANRVAAMLSDRLGAALARRRKDYLLMAADKVIAEVRAGNWFTHDSGVLKQSLAASRPRLTKYDGEIDVLWTGEAAVYGPVLEHGPHKQRWEITPRNLKANGAPIKALRYKGSFPNPAKAIQFVKKVTHIDKPSHRRRHIDPVMRSLYTWFIGKEAESFRGAARDVGFE